MSQQASEFPTGTARFFDAKRWVQLFAVALAVGVGWMLFSVPVYAGQTHWANSDGTSGEYMTQETMAEANGWPLAIIFAAIPLLLTLPPVLVRGRGRQALTVVCTVLLAGIAFVTGFSVGTLYVPPLIAAVCACIVPGNPSQTADSRPAG